MANKKKSSPLKSVLRYALLFSNLFIIACDLTRLVSMEAKIAGKSIGLIIMLLVLLAIMSAATWGCLLALLFLWLTSLHFSITLTLLTLLVLNLLLIFIITLCITHMRKKLSFPITCQECLHLYRKLTLS